MDNNINKKPRVVIIGGGFAGLQVAKNLKNTPVEILMLDKHNYHTFQPLLYQVAVGALPADSIAFPIRRIFTFQDNFNFNMANVLKINPDSNTLDTNIGPIHYDYLVVATGSNTNFLGNDQIAHFAMPMKNVPEALNMRVLVLQNLEKALVTRDEEEREALMTFVVVGGGPTGVELSGALAEMRRLILSKDYRYLKEQHMSVYLIESKERLLAAMSEKASTVAKEYLINDKVTVYNGVRVQSYDGSTLTINNGEVIKTHNVFWAAGVKGEFPEGLENATIARGTRIQTDEINRVTGYQNIFAIGDTSAIISEEFPNGHPGVAPVAIQQGQQLAKNLLRIIKEEPTVPFKYHDKGTLATVGRNKALADIGKLKLTGFIAWILWGFVHIMSLAGFSNKAAVFMEWVINYLTKNSDNRLILRPFNTETRKVDPDH
ncbi:NADH dehydrogenase [Mucilaginibacter auburnensis]|uniref:NADH:ubiquinone reductase (non-electrogenic) n=2 Tax=Mucilaginibacter auburnensis TaxID=1457233 RepID=A0A2H9VVE2_9SPHI|nr:NADH dehydrogenase [Mucilaginibacter auburnensis]